jgi:hypothetical protein
MLKQFLQFIREEKKWILIPLLVLVVLAVAAIFLFRSNSGISWALYPNK